MQKADVKNLVDLIVIHRPYFKTRLGDSVYQELLNEWTRIMGPYDYDDIKANLENFLKEENNYGREPDAYQLIRGIYTIEEKNTNIKGRVSCMFCNRIMSRLEIHKHEDRCRSIHYIDRLYKRFFHKELADKRTMYEMQDEEFNKKYINVLEAVYPFVTNLSEKKSISNVIETYYGREPKYTLDEVL